MRERKDEKEKEGEIEQLEILHVTSRHWSHSVLGESDLPSQKLNYYFVKQSLAIRQAKMM